jgi:drug/metabolite transporter (DMT)-like permease
MKSETSSATAATGSIVVAFAAVYLIWGSTYLGIRYAVESIPPFLMAGSRNLAAGLLLYAIARARNHTPPSRVEWRDAAIAGGLMLALGNGGVTWAEQVIPSGVTALLVALTPVWMVLLDWLRPGGVRPRPFVVLGLAVGILGVALLAHGGGNHSGAGYEWGIAALMLASVGWACGSIFNRQARKPASPLLGVAMQMIAGGLLMLGFAVVRGEMALFSTDRITWLSAGSWVYLTVAGSMVGYTAYVWLLHASTPARVATYAYVNPLIAVLLGCTVGHEPFSHDLFVAGALIIAAVVLIVRGGAARTNATTQCEEVA